MCESCGCSEERQFEPSEPREIVSLVDYAEGSVVSRTLVDKDTGTITLFAFEEGESLSEHTTPYDALVQVLDGEATLIIGGEEVRAGAGQMVLMPADIPHAVRARQRFKMLLTMIRER